jgi:hypothetical protein
LLIAWAVLNLCRRLVGCLVRGVDWIGRSGLGETFCGGFCSGLLIGW